MTPSLSSRCVAFPFESLPSYGARDAQAMDYLCRLIPAAGGNVGENSFQSIKKYLGNFDFQFHGIELQSEGHFLGREEKMTPLAVFSVPTSDSKVLVKIDAALARTSVDRVLGSKIPSARGPFSVLEKGVLEFLILKVLESLAVDRRAIKWTLDGVRTVGEVVAQKDTGFIVHVTVRVNDQSGSLRIFLPLEVTDSLSETDAEDMILNQSQEEAKFGGVGHFRVPSWAEVGSVTLSTEEIAQLRSGDIILLDEFYPDFDGKNLSGEVKIKFADGESGGILASLQDQTKAKLEQVFID